MVLGGSADNDILKSMTLLAVKVVLPPESAQAEYVRSLSRVRALIPSDDPRLLLHACAICVQARLAFSGYCFVVVVTACFGPCHPLRQARFRPTNSMTSPTCWTGTHRSISMGCSVSFTL